MGPATDIYSIGAILYELLTGRPPFKADSPLQTISQVVNQEPVSPCILNPAVPKDLETICLKCLQKEPKRRYASSAELASELDHFLAGEPIKARPVGRLERLIKWTRRQPAQAALVVVSLLAVIGVLALILSHNAQLRTERDFSQQMKRDAELNEDKSLRTLARSRFEQARSERLAGGLGRRWNIEQLLNKAMDAIPSQHPPHASAASIKEANEITPSSYELRNAITSLMILSDALPLGRLRGSIRSLSPDGRFAIINDALIPGRSRLRIADSGTGKQVADLQGLSADVFAISAGAEMVAHANKREQSVLLVDSDSKVTINRLTWPSNNRLRTSSELLNFSQDGHWLVGKRKLYNFGTQREAQIALWPISEVNPQVIELETSTLNMVPPKFSRSGSHLFYDSGANQLSLRNLSSQQDVAIFEYTKSKRSLQQIAVSQKGELAAAVLSTAKNPVLLVWDAASKQQVLNLPVELAQRAVRGLEFSPDGRHIAVATDQKQILIIDIALGDTILRLDHDANQLCWTADKMETNLISSGPVSLTRWQIAIPNYLSPVPLRTNNQTPIARFRISHIGNLVAAIQKRRLSLFDWPSGRLKWSSVFDAEISDFGFSPDDSQLFVCGYGLGAIVDSTSGQVVSNLPISDSDLDPVQGMFQSSDKLFFNVERGGGGEVWDALENKRIWPPDAKKRRFTSNSVLLGANNELLANSVVKGSTQLLWTTEIWGLNSNGKKSSFPGEVFGSFCPDNRWLTTTRIAGQEVAEPIQATAVLNMLSRPLQEEQVSYTVWNLETGEPQLEFSDISASILDDSDQNALIEFSDDGQSMIAVKTDGTFEFWNIANQKPLFSFSLQQLQGISTRLEQVRFGPGNKTLLCLFEKSNVILRIELDRIKEQWNKNGVGW